jgi:N-acetylmuramoyl-L-alanine amidase
MKIFIDPGHNYSRFDTGATGNGLREQDITFQVGEKLAALLKCAGFEVLMSRNKLTDNVGANFSTSLSQRATLANNAKADYFISLHCDGSTSSSAKGSHICIYSKNSVAERLANKITPHLLALGLDGRSNLISERPELAVLKKTSMPAILIEMGFITNPRDAEIQKNNQDGLANAIFMGFCDYLGIPYSKKEQADTVVSAETTIKIDGKLIDIDSTNINGSIYVSIRKFCESIGYSVDWNDETRVVNICSSGENTADNKAVEMPSTSPISPTKYSIIGTTHVLEIDPRNVSNVETQKATNKTPCNNFVNGTFFMMQANGKAYPLGITANEGQVFSNYITHNKPVATLIVYTDGTVTMKYVSDITKENNVKFAVSGYGIYPKITAKEEGFTGVYSDVLRTTNRPIIGYRKSDNKIVIAVRANSDANRAKETAKNLNLDFAISLDAGGSTTLKVNGAYKFKGDGRQLWGGITWS